MKADRLYWLAAFGLIAGSVVFEPRTLPAVDACLFHALTGHSCPGCGLVRGLCSISHGHFRAAWSFNPLAYIVYTSAVVMVLWPLTGHSSADLLRWTVRRRYFPYALLTLTAIMVGFNFWRLAH